MIKKFLISLFFANFLNSINPVLALSDTERIDHLEKLLNELKDELLENHKQLTGEINKRNDQYNDLKNQTTAINKKLEDLSDNTIKELTVEKTLLDEREKLNKSLEVVLKEINNQQITIGSQQSTINNLKQNPVPIGFIYVQLYGQPNPEYLWPEVKWEDVTSYYAGLFFRAGGGKAAPFGSVQYEDAPRLSKVDEGHGDNYENPINIGVGQWSLPIYTGMDDGVAYSGPKSANLKFYVSDAEVRPRNTAVLIWKRYK